MKKEWYKTWWAIILVIILIFLLIEFIAMQIGLNKTEGIIQDDKTIEKVELIFYDNETSCPLNGEVYFGETPIGLSNNGRLNVSREDYDLFWIGEVGIKGRTDSCFETDFNLPLIAYWGIEDLEYYFYNKEPITFLSEDLSLRSPSYPEAMQDFIRPEEVIESFSRININENDSQLENIEKILGYTYMNWVSDMGRFNQQEYWQTPANFILNRGGDCEDWAIYTLSLLKAYNPNLNCYAAVWYSHMNIICQINQIFIIIDQQKIKKTLKISNEQSLQTNQINIRSWRNNYFKEYGISPDERILFYLFNEKEFIQFEDGQEDFVNWVLERGKII